VPHPRSFARLPLNWALVDNIMHAPVYVCVCVLYTLRRVQFYHRACVDQALAISMRCAICRADVNVATQPLEDDEPLVPQNAP
jgi:hypothetical protein